MGMVAALILTGAILIIEQAVITATDQTTRFGGYFFVLFLALTVTVT